MTTERDIDEIRDSAELYAIVTAMAGEGDAMATSRRDGASVYSLPIDNQCGRYATIPECRWTVIYAMWPETGELMIEHLANS